MTEKKKFIIKYKNSYSLDLKNKEINQMSKLYIKQAQALLNAGVDINQQNNDNQTALIGCCKNNGTFKSIKFLLVNGAKVNIKDKFGMTALMYAVTYSDNPKVIKILMKYGADPSIEDKNGNTAFDYIQKNKNLTDTMLSVTE